MKSVSGFCKRSPGKRKRQQCVVTIVVGAICFLGAGIRLRGEDPRTPALTDKTVEHIEFADLKFLMATPWTFRFYASNPVTAKQALAEITQRVKDLTLVMSDYEPESEVRRLYETAQPKQPVQISQDLFDVLCLSKSLHQQTFGQFDVTLGPVIDLWRQTKLTRILPTKVQIANAQQRSGMSAICLHCSSRSITMLKSQMHIDLGGIGKGFAADEAAKVFQRHGISSYLIDAGGTVLVGDPPPGKSHWIIQTQFGTVHSKVPSQLELANRAVSTSGDQHRYVEIEGTRYSHIVNPATGLGATQSRTAMVIGNCAAKTDAYATAFCLMSPEQIESVLRQLKSYHGYIVESQPGDAVTKPVIYAFPTVWGCESQLSESASASGD